jgi:hypothetical protein
MEMVCVGEEKFTSFVRSAFEGIIPIDNGGKIIP